MEHGADMVVGSHTCTFCFSLSSLCYLHRLHNKMDESHSDGAGCRYGGGFRLTNNNSLASGWVKNIPSRIQFKKCLSGLLQKPCNTHSSESDAAEGMGWAESELLGPNNKIYPEEENVEVICQFFITTGKQLDESLKSKRINDLYFNRLRELSTNQQLTIASCLTKGGVGTTTNSWPLA
ncbi:hypothetical protein M8C21_019937 [Ambrosia artemisiifolia]|uniref:Uncharacterized protein n=1 Tax=Ambrosia artemisiifolia TaxID=4212 RepID=A0AAD5GJU6_AMBAR|nr:hypothetical protein M8C21_019937 [Ambrosia artemisiifolia]